MRPDAADPAVTPLRRAEAAAKHNKFSLALRRKVCYTEKVAWMMTIGFRATSCREPCQGRKAAAISGSWRAPRRRPVRVQAILFSGRGILPRLVPFLGRLCRAARRLARTCRALPNPARRSFGSRLCQACPSQAVPLFGQVTPELPARAQFCPPVRRKPLCPFFPHCLCRNAKSDRFLPARPVFPFPSPGLPCVRSGYGAPPCSPPPKAAIPRLQNGFLTEAPPGSPIAQRAIGLSPFPLPKPAVRALRLGCAVRPPSSPPSPSQQKKQARRPVPCPKPAPLPL